MNLLSLLSLATHKLPQGLDRAAAVDVALPNDGAVSTFAGLLTQAQVEPVKVLPVSRPDTPEMLEAMPSLSPPRSLDEVSPSLEMVDRVVVGDSTLPPRDDADGDCLPEPRPDAAIAHEHLDLVEVAPTPTVPLEVPEVPQLLHEPTAPGVKPNDAAAPGSLPVVYAVTTIAIPLALPGTPLEKLTLAEGAAWPETSAPTDRPPLPDKTSAGTPKVELASPAGALHELAPGTHMVGERKDLTPIAPSAQRSLVSQPESAPVRLFDRAPMVVAPELSTRGEAPATKPAQQPRPDAFVASPLPTPAPVPVAAPTTVVPPALPPLMTAVESVRAKMPGVAIDGRMMTGAARSEAGEPVAPRPENLPGSRPVIDVQPVHSAVAESSVDADPATEPSVLKLEGAAQRTPDPQANMMPRLQAVPFIASNMTRFSAELGDRVFSLRAHALDRASIMLEPAELGRIEIRLRLDSDTTHVSFVVHNSSVRDALEAQLPRLRTMLESSGLLLGDVDVDQFDHQGGRDQTGQPRQVRRVADRSGPATIESRTEAGGRRVDGALVDVHA